MGTAFRARAFAKLCGCIAMFLAGSSLFASGILVLSHRAIPQSEDGDRVTRSLMTNVVRIESQLRNNRTENGFGFVAGERSGLLYVVTAYHVVSDSEDIGGKGATNVKVEFFDHQGEMVDAKLLGTHDATHDLAVLTIPIPQGFRWNKKCLAEADQGRRGSAVWFIGRSQRWDPPFAPGHIVTESPIDWRIRVEGLPVRPGSSGGPLIAVSGIIGLIQSDSVDDTTALSIEFVRDSFQKWNHPWDLEQTSGIGKTAIGDTNTMHENQLHEGAYELYTLSGAPQKKGVIMRLRKVSDGRFLAETSSPSGYSWNGELRRKGDGWELVIVSWTQGAVVPNSGAVVSRQGPLLTIGNFVWREQ